MPTFRHWEDIWRDQWFLGRFNKVLQIQKVKPWDYLGKKKNIGYQTSRHSD